ncbi:MAG: chromosome segregation protein SMC [Roseburia sp.]|nr:chromosome segregation protein SMC [Roseburia sp.]MCM1278922.1 chromosome segregation protein SMC [Robinsoniella sp.]
MYLKSIEVHGFKSFANKINFQFHNGITGIVGPNGSGKSNVADAVRWVLGEQRIKQLRGASMQDVIFSGTENRKPLGYAYVAITLDNSDHSLAIDYEEVTVARRIYRSGESEYLINGTACRLKDVNELFYDTGIGKEGYSIIGQGQIDKILSGKPEERRELFDEAAGIVKFKRRKTTAQKKLEDEKQNLVRVNDILSELEKQTGPLEKQSETAKVYLKKKEELKTLDVNAFLLENNRLKEELNQLEEKYRIAKDDLDATSSKYENIKNEYEAIQNEMEELDAAIVSTREMLSNSSVMRGKLEGEINVLKEQIKSAKANEEHFLTRQKNIKGDIARKEADKQEILEEKKQFDEQLANLELVRKEAKEELLNLQKHMEELNESIEAGKNTIINALNERATIKSKIGRFDTMLEQISIRRAELNSRILRAKSDEAEQLEVIKQLEAEFQEVTDCIQKLNEQQSLLEEKNHEATDKLAATDKKLRDTQVLYHQEKSKLESITNLTERYEGYGNSIRRVMEEKEKNPGIIGVVADIIKVEAKYETAIETALGGNIQNIVTDDEETAKKMIGFLKKNKYGRATFLPLTSILHPQEFKTPQVLEEQGAIGMANELVKVEKKYENVAKAMLGRIVVIDNVDHAVKIARKFDYGVRMVTLEGELLVPGGAISGGAFKNSSNLLGRRREMEQLKEQVAGHLKEIDVLLDEIEQTKAERNKIRKEIEEGKEQLQKRFIEQNTKRLNVMKAEEKKSEVGKGFEELNEEQNELESQAKELKEEKQAILNELKASEEMEKNIEKQIGEFQTVLEDERERENAQSAKVSELDMEAEKLIQKQEFEQENIDRILGEISRYEGELAEINENLEKLLKEAEQKEANIGEIEKTIAASHTMKGESEEKLNQDIARKEELSGKQKNFFTEREKMAEQMTSLDKEVYRLGSQKERLEESIETQINYMWNEYEITLSDAASMKNEEMTDLPAMKKEIFALKDAIKKLGDVNVNAIEDYKNLMERYEFLKNQHDDLVQAEETLLGIIDELDAAMRKQFAEKFEEISKEFDKVFKELFGGGKGTLELMEDEDILEAGIKINAQPPGKKLQNMMQLSGGEKALAAISLLFAIQNLKPSPFCLLDEIEAALDESNVSRFAGYLHKLTKHTQFIVITHRRGTMEKADRLYGITMQEKGVSALVSVNLIDKDLMD